MADCETQRFEWLNLFKMIVNNVDRRGNHKSKLACQRQSLTGNPPSCKILPLHTWTIIQLQNLHPQLNGVMLSPLAGSPAADLAHLDTGDPKAFKVIGISYDEAECQGLSLRHHTQVIGLSFSLSLFYRVLSGLAPSAPSVLCPSRILQGKHGPLNHQPHSD